MLQVKKLPSGGGSREVKRKLDASTLVAEHARHCQASIERRRSVIAVVGFGRAREDEDEMGVGWIERASIIYRQASGKRESSNAPT